MKKRLLLLGLIVNLTVSAVAVIDDMKFSRLDTRDGLSNSQIISIFRDSKGFMWFSTPYGLNRYDGYRFKTFYSVAKDTTTLRSNYVDEVFEAFDGKLWIRQNMNYTVYDPVTEKFDRHPELWLREHGVKGGIETLVSALLLSMAKVCWFHLLMVRYSALTVKMTESVGRAITCVSVALPTIRIVSCVLTGLAIFLWLPPGQPL